jgi:hypothetical protein
MASVHIVLGSCRIGSRAGITRIPEAVPVLKQTITSSGASQASTTAAPADHEGERFWSITVSGGPVWVAFGEFPVASAGNDWLLLDGATREFAAAAGQKVAVIDA